MSASINIIEFLYGRDKKPRDFTGFTQINIPTAKAEVDFVVEMLDELIPVESFIPKVNIYRGILYNYPLRW